MKVTVNKFLSVALALLVLWGAPETALAAKPQGPLTVTIKAAGKVKPGATARFDVTVVTQMDGDMTITLFPPPGAKVKAGETLWRGEVGARGRKTLSVTLELPVTEQQEFRATATIIGPNNARFGAGASYPIATAKSSAAPKQKRGTRQGQEIIEVPVPAK